jgi:uncharacterized protein YbcI
MALSARSSILLVATLGNGLWEEKTLRKGTMKTRGELEAEISQAIIRFEKEVMGRGPLETRTYLLDDLVLVRLKGVLTPAEIKLAETTDRQRGRYLLKQVRQELLDHGRPILDGQIRDILGVSVRSLHTDISTKTGERIIVFTLESKPALDGEETRRGRGACPVEGGELELHDSAAGSA